MSAKKGEKYMVATKNKKKYARYKEGAEMYSMGINKFTQLAHEAGAVYKVDRLVLVNLDIFDEYLQTFKLE